MMHALKLIGAFFKISTQGEMAYRANFFIRCLHALVNLVTGILSLTVIFNQVEDIKGWDLPSALVLLGIYLLLGSVRGLFIGPSLEAMAGMDGEVWKGTFDFTLLRPVNKQFFVSFRHWRIFALFDIALALGVLSYAVHLLDADLSLTTLFSFFITLLASLVLLYACLLAFSALVFLNSGFLFTWIINDLYTLARYPVGLYPGWLRLILTWIIPVGLMTTIPAQALMGTLSPLWMAVSIIFSLCALLGASWLFRRGLEKYASASS